MSDTGAMQSARPPRGIVLGKAPQRRAAFRRPTLVGLFKAELLEPAEFADFETDTRTAAMKPLMGGTRQRGVCSYSSGENAAKRCAGVVGGDWPVIL
jgi:hypothetical protein